MKFNFAEKQYDFSKKNDAPTIRILEHGHTVLTKSAINLMGVTKESRFSIQGNIITMNTGTRRFFNCDGNEVLVPESGHYIRKYKHFAFKCRPWERLFGQGHFLLIKVGENQFQIKKVRNLGKEIVIPSPVGQEHVRYTKYQYCPI
jgi:hypothetical protein